MSAVGIVLRGEGGGRETVGKRNENGIAESEGDGATPKVGVAVVGLVQRTRVGARDALSDDVAEPRDVVDDWRFDQRAKQSCEGGNY